MKKYLGLEDISNTNCSNVLHVIREAGVISRKGISDETGLSWAGMTKIVNKLFEKGLLEESKYKSTSAGAGRIPNVIRICRDKNIVLGVDINQEGLRGCIINLGGEIQKEYSAQPDYINREELLERIKDFIGNMIENHKHQNILAIGVAMQGEFDAETGISVNFPGCEDWNNVPIKEILENSFEYKVYIEHDPNCILYSQIVKEKRGNTILFRIDRSIGMAAYIDGKIIRGKGLLEVKNCIVSPDGKEVDKIRKGSLEAYVYDCIHGKEYHEQGVKDLIPLFANFIYNMGRVFHAESVILTGELIGYKVYFQEELCNEFQKYLIKDEIELLFMDEIKKAVYGAALIAAQAAIDSIEL